MSIGKELLNKIKIPQKEQTYFHTCSFEIEKLGMGYMFSANTTIRYKSPTVSMNNDLF